MGKNDLMQPGDAAHLPVLAVYPPIMLAAGEKIIHSAIIAARSRVFHRKSLLRLFTAVLIASLILLAAGALAVAEGNDSGFKTAQPSMLTAVMPGVEITLLLRIPGL